LEILESVKGRRVAERVAGQIRNAVVRGELTHSDSLPAEAQLMELFAVSRPTLREAIRILEGENLIEVSRGPRGGARVKRFTPELAAKSIGQTLQASHTTLKDVFIARRTIEPPAAAMAAADHSKSAALALRKQIITEYESIGQFPRIAQNMSEFHIRLVEVSGNQTLALLGRALQQIVLTHMALYGYARTAREESAEALGRQRASLQSHERLADLIERGDAVGAEAHWRDHMDRWIPVWLEPPLDTAVLDVLERPDAAVEWRST
jgi:DNA-binding FadR family transcriptional regulator